MHLHEIGEHIDRVLAADASGYVNGQALSRRLVDNNHELDGPAVMGSVKDKVPGPDVILVLWPQSDTRSIIQPQPSALRLP